MVEIIKTIWIVEYDSIQLTVDNSDFFTVSVDWIWVILVLVG
jgi:hypothetical protein